MDVYRVVDSILRFLGPYRVFWIAIGRERNNKETRYFLIRLFYTETRSCISYVVRVVAMSRKCSSKDFLIRGEISRALFLFSRESLWTELRSFKVSSKIGKKKLRDAKLFRILIFRIFCQVCRMRARINWTRGWIKNSQSSKRGRGKSALSTMAIRQCRDRGTASLPDWFIWITVLIQLWIVSSSNLYFPAAIFNKSIHFYCSLFQLLETQRTVLLAVYKLGTRSIILQPSSKYDGRKKWGKIPCGLSRLCERYASIPNVRFRDEQFRNFCFFFQTRTSYCILNPLILISFVPTIFYTL